MNDQLQVALADILGKASDAAQGGVVFLQGQLPDVVRQLLMWKAVASGISCLLGIALLTATFYLARKFWAWFREIEDSNDCLGTLIVAAGLSLVGTLIGLVLISFKWLQILIAPKIFLIEYAASLAKGAT